MPKDLNSLHYTFGVANHSPDAVLPLLQRAQIVSAPENIQIVARDAKYHRRKNKAAIVFLSVRDFRRAVRKLATQKPLHIFIFDSSVALSQVDVTPLDYNKPTSGAIRSSFVKISITTLRKTKLRSVTHFSKEKTLHSMIEQVRTGSLLNPLMSFLYTLPATAQTRIKKKVAEWLYDSKSEAALEKMLDSKEISISEKALKRLKDILFSEAGKKYHDFFRLMSLDSNIKSRASEYGVDPYEVSYLLSVVEHRKENFADSYDKAKNRNVK